MQVRAVLQTVLKQVCGAMRKQGIAFHFSKSNCASNFAPFDRLSRDRIYRTSRPYLPLISRHVAQSLVMHYAHKYINLERLARVPRVKHLITVETVSRSEKLLAKVLRGGALFVKAERRRVLKRAMHCARLAAHRFHHHSNRHPARKPVWIEQDIGNDAALAVRHVFLRPHRSKRSFLPVPRRKLITNHRRSIETQLDHHAARTQRGGRRICARREHPHLVHHRRFGRLV
mmetsp:Transcript_10905/g.29226  ORF Transcript_10905/g.29226 Transcript_10905/m.29226 type:complete len:230 (-) Transcript_10905:259-948(-)